MHDGAPVFQHRNGASPPPFQRSVGDSFPRAASFGDQPFADAFSHQPTFAPPGLADYRASAASFEAFYDDASSRPQASPAFDGFAPPPRLNGGGPSFEGLGAFLPPPAPRA